MAVLECFRSTPVGRSKKGTPQTHRPTGFLQTDSSAALDKATQDGAAPKNEEQGVGPKGDAPKTALLFHAVRRQTAAKAAMAAFRRQSNRCGYAPADRPGCP
jgi:hypothetical protein